MARQGSATKNLIRPVWCSFAPKPRDYSFHLAEIKETCGIGVCIELSCERRAL